MEKSLLSVEDTVLFALLAIARAGRFEGEHHASFDVALSNGFAWAARSWPSNSDVAEALIPIARKIASLLSSEERAKVASEERAKVASEERAKVASEERAKVASEERAKVASEERAKVASEERSKVASEERSKAAPFIAATAREARAAAVAFYEQGMGSPSNPVMAKWIEDGDSTLFSHHPIVKLAEMFAAHRGAAALIRERDAALVAAEVAGKERDEALQTAAELARVSASRIQAELESRRLRKEALEAVEELWVAGAEMADAVQAGDMGRMTETVEAWEKLEKRHAE